MSDNSLSSNDRLNRAFEDGDVLNADIPALVSLLKDESEVVEVVNPRVKERNPKRALFIRDLIAIRQKEKTLRQEGIKSTWTIIISAVTLILLVFKTGCDINSEFRIRAAESTMHGTVILKK